MKTLKELIKNPSGFDSVANYSGDVPNDKWLVVMTRNRESDILTESNWACALDLLGGESDNVEIFRFGHWACGWWEALCVNGKSINKGQEIFDKIYSYPVLNEDHFSELEREEADRLWLECYDKKDRLEYIRENRYQFDFNDFKDLMSCVRGKYFAGYASELVS